MSPSSWSKPTPLDMILSYNSYRLMRQGGVAGGGGNIWGEKMLCYEIGGDTLSSCRVSETLRMRWGKKLQAVIGTVTAPAPTQPDRAV